MFHCVDIRGHSRSHSRRGSMDVLDEDLPVMKCFSAFQQSVISYRWWWSTQAKAYWRQRRKTMRLRYENREIIVHCSLKVEICGHNLQSAAPRFFFYFCGAMGGKPCFSAGMGSLFFLRKQNVQWYPMCETQLDKARPCQFLQFYFAEFSRIFCSCFPRMGRVDQGEWALHMLAVVRSSMTSWVRVRRKRCEPGWPWHWTPLLHCDENDCEPQVRRAQGSRQGSRRPSVSDITAKGGGTGRWSRWCWCWCWCWGTGRWSRWCLESIFYIDI